MLAYNVETAFLPLFVRRVRFYLTAWILYQRGKNTRLKRLFKERGAKHSVGVFAIFAGARGRLHAAWLHGVFVGWFAAKYTLNVFARGAAARFYLSTLRGFCFVFGILFFRSSSSPSPSPSSILFFAFLLPCFSFLPSLFLVFVFFSFLFFCSLFSFFAFMVS